jgi:hypothetical protein
VALATPLAGHPELRMNDGGGGVDADGALVLPPPGTHQPIALRAQRVEALAGVLGTSPASHTSRFLSCSSLLSRHEGA